MESETEVKSESASGVPLKGGDEDPSGGFKVPLASVSQQQQQQLNSSTGSASSRVSPPSTPPHNRVVSEHGFKSPTHVTQGRRLSIDKLNILIPKTPDHQNLNNGFENTPLQSPTKTPRSAKRRSTDSYHLLNTPDHKVYKSNSKDDDDEEHSSRQAKRSSLELYKLLDSEDNRLKLVQKSPTRESSTVFNDSSSTSPVKNSYRVKKSETEIKELSQNLKSRLNYAFLKVQNGWTEKPLSELEKKSLSPSMGSPPRISALKPRPLSLHGTSVVTPRIRLDEFAASRSHGRRNSLSSTQTNANVALLTALSPRSSKHEVDPEKTAAISLMKLSSPIKQNATIFSNSNQSSPTKKTGSLELEEETNKTETETDVEEDDIDMSIEKLDR